MTRKRSQKRLFFSELRTAEFWAIILAIFVLPGAIFWPIWGWLTDWMGPDIAAGMVVIVQTALVAGREGIEQWLKHRWPFKDHQK